MKIEKTRLLAIGVLMANWHLAAHGATLAGVVADEGEIVVGAEVILVNASNNVLLGSTYTDRGGAFTFAVDPGIFNVGIFRAEYSTAWSKNVKVGDTDVLLQIELTPEAFSESSSSATSSSSDDCE